MTFPTLYRQCPDGTWSIRATLRFTEIVARLNDQLDADIGPEYVPNPIPEGVSVHDACADITKIRDEAGWGPHIDLEEGLEHVCRPYQ